MCDECEALRGQLAVMRAALEAIRDCARDRFAETRSPADVSVAMGALAFIRDHATSHISSDAGKGWHGPGEWAEAQEELAVLRADLGHIYSDSEERNTCAIARDALSGKEPPRGAT